jgi:hypothetical protein
MSLLTTLAKKHNVKEDEAAVIRANDALLSVRSALVAALNVSEDISDEKLASLTTQLSTTATQRKSLLEAVAKVVSVKLAADKTDKLKLESGAASLTEQLSALFRAGGVENVDAAVSRIVDTMKAAATLEQVMPELKSLQMKG